MSAFDIAGYTFGGENYTPENLIEAMIAAGELSPAARDMTVEDALDQHAAVNVIDRMDESSFDTDEHPKVIFADQLDEENDSDWFDFNNQSMKGKTMTTEQMWDKLIELGVSEQSLQIVSAINGYNTQTMEDVLYAHTAYRNFDQLED